MSSKAYLKYLQPDYAEPTEDERFLAEYKQTHLIKRWNEFLSEVVAQSPWPNEVRCKDLLAVPKLRTIKAFFGWLAEEKPGRSGGKRCLGTLLKDWVRLHCIIKLRTNFSFEKSEVDGMTKHIEGFVLQGMALAKGATKGLANATVTRDVLQYLWACDEHVFNHPRERVQLAFCILMFAILSIRPGEITESINHRGSNEGLKYKDCEISVLRSGQLQLLFNRRLRKGYRLKPGEAHRYVLTEVPQDRSRCPLTLFLALAVADGALTYADIQDLRVSRGANSRTLKARRNMLDVPVLRSTINHDRISKDAILKYPTLEYQLTELGRRAGYSEALTPYCFRRGVGAILDKNVTVAERMQIMGHDNTASFRAYQSDIVGVHPQALMFGDLQDMARIDFVRSMSFKRDGQAPSRSTAFLKKSGVRAPRVRRSAQELLQYRRAQRQKLRGERSRHFAGERESDDSDTISSEEDEFEAVEDGTIERIRPKASPWMDILLKYDTTRAEVIQNFYPEKDGKEISLQQAVDPLLKMADPSPWHLSYPIPGIDGTVDQCPWCLKPAELRGRLYFNNHLIACYKKHRSGLCNEAKETCVLRSMKFPTPRASADTCVTSGLVASETSGAKLADDRMASQGINVFGPLRFSRCLWNHCNFDFVDKRLADISAHMTMHANRSKRRCGWLGCKVNATTPAEMQAHMAEAHSVPCDAVLEDKTFYCHQCAWWATSEHAWEQHCGQHLTSLADPFCGQLVKKGVALFASLCPFCLGKNGRPSQRYRQFSAGNVRGHILNHIRSLCGWTPRSELEQKRVDADAGIRIAAEKLFGEGSFMFQCPHPLCKSNSAYFSPPEFLIHLGEYHGLPFATEQKKEPCDNAEEETEGAVEGASNQLDEDATQESGVEAEATGSTLQDTTKRKRDCSVEAAARSCKVAKIA